MAMAMAQAHYVQRTSFSLRSEPPVRSLQFLRNVVPRLGDPRSRSVFPYNSSVATSSPPQSLPKPPIT